MRADLVSIPKEMHNLLEQISRLSTGTVEGQVRKSCLMRLKDTIILPLEIYRTRKDIIETFEMLKGLAEVNAWDVSVQHSEARTRSNGSKLWKE